MHTLVLINPHSGNAHLSHELADRLSHRLDHRVVWPETTELSTVIDDAIHEGCRRVLAVGGDGTAHLVVNALANHLDHVTFGVLPLGTGNDLARSLAIPPDPMVALEIIDRQQERRIDLIDIQVKDRHVIGVNVASGGFSGRAGESVTHAAKSSWGPFAYVLGAAAGSVTGLITHQTELALDGGAVQNYDALSVVVANGRFAAGGWTVASPADLEDGLLDLVIVPAGPLIDLAGVAADLLAGDYLDSGLVVHLRAASARIASEPSMTFRIDGEPLEGSPITFTVRPRALRVIVGPEYGTHRE